MWYVLIWYHKSCRSRADMISSVWTPTASSGNATRLPSLLLLTLRRDRGRRLTPLMTEYPMWLMPCLGPLLRRHQESNSRYIPRNGGGLASHLRTKRLDRSDSMSWVLFHSPGVSREANGLEVQEYLYTGMCTRQVGAANCILPALQDILGDIGCRQQVYGF